MPRVLQSVGLKRRHDLRWLQVVASDVRDEALPITNRTRRLRAPSHSLVL